MSVRLHRGGWEVRWRDAAGRQRARRFPSEVAARAFDEAIAEVSPGARRADSARHGRSGGVYSYRTAEAVRWRFVYRRSDGTRTTKRGFGRWESAGVSRPVDRTTVSRDWHKDALQDAALRDMPLHALRHTAAAAWLAAGNSLMYVQRQLGHADIGTTERYYGHLERHVLAAGAIATEDAIARAARGRR
jgi:integrase